MPSYYLFLTSLIPIFTSDRSFIDAHFIHLYSNTGAKKWFHLCHKCFPGDLMTTDISKGEIASQTANDQGVGQYPYPTQVCTITLVDSFFCSLFLVFLGHRSFFFILFLVHSFPSAFWTCFCSIPHFSPSRKPFPPFESVIVECVECHSSHPNSLLLLFAQRIRSFNLCTCMRTGNA